MDEENKFKNKGVSLIKNREDLSRDATIILAFSCGRMGVAFQYCRKYGLTMEQLGKEYDEIKSDSERYTKAKEGSEELSEYIKKNSCL